MELLGLINEPERLSIAHYQDIFSNEEIEQIVEEIADRVSKGFEQESEDESK